ncbi:hypothetical protein QFC21_004705 [Naganishia friedmannii]|uniref:Uncharacterized protein n=1 Tax=Naganishia friedmannii TaxID=89922 RepID=A0ACC2VF39_9TREE|nr:hypothetical protein QFC21_004705 [Naganishia friedmannii]
MDALLSEITNKRKDLQDPVGSSRANKYMRKGDIERAREEEERKQRAEEEKKKREARDAKDKERNARLNVVRNRTGATSKSPAVGTPGADDSDAPSKPEAFNISSAECIRRLRAKGEPILLFGETEKERRFRLRALELLEERGGSTAQGQNEFKKFLEEAETGLSMKEEEKKRQPAAAAAKSTKSRDDTADGTPGAGNEYEETAAQKSKAVSTTEGEEQVLDLNLVKTDPRKVYPLIYYALKKVLREWADFLDERPGEFLGAEDRDMLIRVFTVRSDDIKRSVQGKNAAATQAQTAEYLKPLFKQLRNRALEHDVLRLLAEIIHYMQKREYQAANDAYLRLSIGNAAWPIGVTMVGIHERSAREKIGQDSVAHVLNDEVSRKYIQSVKRLLTFAQTIRPPSDIAHMMG